MCREALRADDRRMVEIEKDESLKETVFGGDINAFQDLLRASYAAEMKRVEKEQQALGERTIDAQRTDAPVPRDTVQLYEQMREAGLEYGPAFRLLRNVHVPESVMLDD